LIKIKLFPNRALKNEIEKYYKYITYIIMDFTPDEFICPITLDIMNDPVLCEDGYTYERDAIMSTTITLSPMTRQSIDKTKLFPNRALKNAIERFISYSNSQVQNDLLEKQKNDELYMLKKETLEEKNLINKYNKINPSFEIGNTNIIKCESGYIYDFERAIFYNTNGDYKYEYKDEPTQRKYVFDISLIKLIKNDNTYLINYKKLVKYYKWINKYVNGINPYIEYIFDKIIPNIDIIINELNKYLVQWTRWDKDSGIISIISYIESTIRYYTELKDNIPKLKSKEYYILNPTEFIFKYNHKLINTDIPENVRTLLYHNLTLTWVKMKINIMDLFVSTINSITQNIIDYKFRSQRNYTFTPINIIESHKKYVFWDTHIKHVCYNDFNPGESLIKDYDYTHFKPFMLLAKNIMDLTLEINT
jgi:hypothetical protein